VVDEEPVKIDVRRVRDLIKEIDQVRLAISVVGTRRQKLQQLARLAQPIHDGLAGRRPELDKVRMELRRRIHDVQVAQVDNVRAPVALEGLLAALRQVEKLDKDKILDVPESFSAGNFSLLNPWGYRDLEAKGAQKAVQSADELIRRRGVKVDLVVSLDPEKTSGFATYSPFDGAVYLDPSKTPAEATEAVLKEFAAYIWLQKLSNADTDVWGGDTEFDVFATAFARSLAGKRVDPEDLEKLKKTMGRGWGA